VWVAVFGRYVDAAARPSIVDVGCGIGMYSDLLAEAFGATVVGVDPSARMRGVAERAHAHPRVRYVAGSAEELPLEDASCDAALMSNVLHHVVDREACARELHRVLRPGGLLLLRGARRVGGDVFPFFDYFPTAVDIDRERVPSADDVLDLFGAAGFQLVAHEEIAQESASSFQEYYERIATRSISTLELISDAEFEEGVARMREIAERESEPKPVIERVDLMVLRRP
jgi:ubiquinone/menaquinone biosynthesis C-methylase UbiE